LRPEQILVTGASGLLGGDLVDRLEHRGPGSTIALLHEHDARPGGAAIVADRVLRGDLTRPGLGLSTDEYRDLQQTLTGFLHVGGTTQFSVTRDDAERINVCGTKRVLELATNAPHLRRLGFVSTAYVAGRRIGRVGEDELQHDEGFVNWYEWSKHEAERLVRSSALPWAIYRPSTLVGSATDGRVRQRNAVHRAVQLYYHGLAPMLPGRANTAIDAIPDEFAAAAVDYLFHHFEPGATYHLCAGAEGAARLSELLQVTGETFSRCDPRWAARGIEPPLPVDPDTFALFERTARETGNEVFVQVAEAMATFAPQLLYPKQFDRTEALAALEPAGICAPPLLSYWPRIVASCVPPRLRTE
jgi:nucleoside-diphosphate-sugar epimerase